MIVASPFACCCPDVASMATIVAVYLSGSLASMVCPVLVVTVEVVMFAFELLLMLTVELPLVFAVVLLVSVADWQPAAASAKAAAAAAKTPLVPFTRRMKVFSSLVWQRWSTGQIVRGNLAPEGYHKMMNDECGMTN